MLTKRYNTLELCQNNNPFLETVFGDHLFIEGDTHVGVPADNLWLGDITVHAGVAGTAAVALEAVV